MITSSPNSTSVVVSPGSDLVQPASPADDQPPESGSPQALEHGMEQSGSKEAEVVDGIGGEPKPSDVAPTKVSTSQIHDDRY
jgi:hypothetical protein